LASDKRPLIGHSPPGSPPHALGPSRTKPRRAAQDGGCAASLHKASYVQALSKASGTSTGKVHRFARHRAGAENAALAAQLSRPVRASPSPRALLTPRPPAPGRGRLRKEKNLLALGVAFFVVRFFLGRWSSRLVSDLSDTVLADERIKDKKSGHPLFFAKLLDLRVP